MESITKGEIIVGVLNCATMSFSNSALKYVSYPTQALVKSCKILPVMFVGILRKVYSYPLSKYISALIITAGLLVFNLARLGSKASEIDMNLTGGLLLLGSLAFDGLVNTQSDIEKKKGMKSHAFHLMVSNNLVGLIMAVGFLCFNYVAVLP